jgi:hypothetical protein
MEIFMMARLKSDKQLRRDEYQGSYLSDREYEFEKYGEDP